MKKLLLCLCILFALLTFLGSFHILNTGGRANAGFSVVPMVLTLVFLTWHRLYKTKETEESGSAAKR